MIRTGWADVLSRTKGTGTGAAFAEDKKDKTPITLHFSQKPNPETRETLKNAGLKWNSIRNEWEGFVSADQVQHLEKLPHATLKKLPQEKE